MNVCASPLSQREHQPCPGGLHLLRVCHGGPVLRVMSRVALSFTLENGGISFVQCVSLKDLRMHVYRDPHTLWVDSGLIALIHGAK
jgi:hypothetical protein